ncbi:hypothetical protein LOTGIDRAFT_174891 [Lottia gigantea]|uniref:Alpha-type protein kinase domain-containing protein n=1 Tax=Lottia gigantea TaxID=225164 RepID=V4AHC8_LOTGI|nr:hypothetical protein LOTGIDRAFT_174891 [Lottia gigantea]ESO96322.1 hypothetical protein LOTGIDRAFT_174891 [Lottia gigantea]
MFSLSNTTLSSGPDQDGCRYWTSFDPMSCSKGDRKKVFGGILNGKGPRRGEIVLIKIFKKALGTELMCRNEMCKNQKARELSQEFNKRYHFQHIEFSSILNAIIDDVSLSNSLLNSHRKIFKSEWVLMEENVGKHFVTFIDKHGHVFKHCPPILTAFMHWTYHVTSGQLVVCGLEGEQDESICRLKTPTIHSMKKNYGECDSGEKGIKNVFRSHICTNICRDMIKPINQNDSPSRIYPDLPLQPTAPFEPSALRFELEHAHTQLPSPTQYFVATSDLMMSQFSHGSTDFNGNRE